MSSPSSSSGVPFTVFISHAGEDKATIAIPLRERLRERGITACVDEMDMAPGTEAKWAMIRAMETAKIGVIVLSPEFVVKEWPMKELMCFLKRREEYMSNGTAEGVTIPMILPFFYRLSVGDLYIEPDLRRMDKDGVLLHEKSRFFEQQEKDEREAKVNEIKIALGKLHGIMGVRNTIEANNDSSYDMGKKREWLIHNICEQVCKVESEMMKIERSTLNGQGTESELRQAENLSLELPVEDAPQESMEEENFYRLAIEDGDVNAMFNLAQLLEKGATDVKEDVVKAEELYRRAIEGGHVNAMYRLARMLQFGAEGLEADVMQAKRLYYRAIESGHVKAMFSLALMLEEGAEGVAQDTVEAEKLYRLAIEAGDVKAMYNLAMMLTIGAEGVKRDVKEAENLLRRAIDAGSTTSMYSLAVMLATGARGFKQDAVEAKRLYRLAIEHGNVNAMYNLALLFENGGKGVKRDAVEAMKLYRRAVEAGHVKSMNNLAALLEKGGKGVERDAVEAVNLYSRAINAGHMTSMKNLGILLHKGAKDVERDPVKSDELLKKYRRAKNEQQRVRFAKFWFGSSK